MNRIIILIFLSMLLSMAGCGIKVVQDDYTLEKIDGDIECEYRIGEEAKWMEECVDSDVRFDKEMFLRLFQEYCQYDPLTGTKDPAQCDLLIKIDRQPEEWQSIRESEFNVRAVFGDDQRNVSIYRYGGKLYFYVLSMGELREPEKAGEYFVELPDDMGGYWQTVIDKVEASISQ